MTTQQLPPGCQKTGSEEFLPLANCRNCQGEFAAPYPDAILCPACQESAGFEMVQVTKPCETCEEPFLASGMKTGERVRIFGKFCERCTLEQEAAKSRAKQAAFVAAKEAQWFEVCPDYYRSSEIVEALKAEAITAPPEFRPPGQGEGATIGKAQLTRNAVKAGRGLLITGPSGVFKTTAMLQGAVKHLVWNGQPVLFVFSADFKNAASRAGKNGEIDNFIKPMVKAPWLFLDDLGNMASTGGSEDALHALIEARMRLKLPLLATTQFTGPDLVRRFTNSERGQSIVRRILTMTGKPVAFPAPLIKE